MVSNDLIGGLALFEERSDNSSHLFCLLYGKINPFPGVGQSGAVIHMSLFRRVQVFIKTAMGPVGTAIAGTRGTVASGAMERTVLGTVRCTLASINTFFIVIAFQGHLTLIGKSSVKPDLLANGGLILADGLCDSGFGGAVGNTSENDTPFLQS